MTISSSLEVYILEIIKLDIANLIISNTLVSTTNAYARQFMETTNLAAMQTHAQAAANLLKALANENRLMILCTLINGELSVGELNIRVPLSQSALSQHLASLREAGLVATRKEAQTVYYSLLGDEAQKIIAVLQSIYCPAE